MFFLDKNTEYQIRQLKTFYCVYCKPSYCIYLCGSRLHSRPLVFFIPICACAELRWFSEFSSVIACYLVCFVFYINNIGNWNIFIATEHSPGCINNFGALWDSIDSFFLFLVQCHFWRQSGARSALDSWVAAGRIYFF